MICPRCGGKTAVTMTRKTNFTVERARRCKNCGFVFYTSEISSKCGVEFLNADRAYKQRKKA